MADPYADFASPDPYAAFASPIAAQSPPSAGPTAASLAAAGYGKQVPIGEQAKAVGTRADDLVRQIASGVTLGGVDRLAAAAGAATGVGGTQGDYPGNLGAQRAATEKSAQELGAPATLAANLGGNVLGAAALPSEALSLPASAMGKAGKLFGIGAGTGAVAGGLELPDWTNTPQTTRDVAMGFGTGGALGTFLPAAGAGIGKGVSALADALRGGPGSADLAAMQTAKQAAYQKVNDMGAAYSPVAFKSLVDEIAADAKKQGINPGLHPGAASVINDMQARAAQGTPVPLPELDQMRQIAWRDSAGKQGPDNGGERFFGNQIRSKIDDFVNAGFPGDMAPMPTSGQPAIKATVTPQETTGAAAAASRPQIPPGPAPESMLDVMRRYGLQDEGGDLKSMGFADKFSRAPKGTLKVIDKTGGIPMDEGMRIAKERGYMEPHEDLSDFIDKLGQHPTYSVQDQEAVAARAARDEYDQRDLGNAAGPATTENAAPFAAPIATDVLPPTASAQESADAIRNARDLAMRQFKAKALAEALDKAEIRAANTGSGGNIENTTRQRLTAILGKEPWSPDELAQLNTMVRGTPITNTARSVSRLSPWGNGLNLMLEGGFAGMGNPFVAPAATAGLLAQGAGALARRNAQNKLMTTILAGGKAPAPSAAIPSSRAAMVSALAANADLQRQRNQTTPQ